MTTIFSNINDFTGDKFAPTPWETAKKKARFARTFIQFVESDFPRRDFSEAFYRRLASTFGHVAHRHHFYADFFTSTAGKSRFLRETMRYPCHGDPAFTYSDVGKALQSWLMQKYEHPLATTERVPAVEVQPHVNQDLLDEFKAAYRTENLRPVRGFFFYPGKRVDLACPLVALAIHKGVVDRTDPELGTDDAANPALEWAAHQFGEEWVVGLLDGFDRQEKARADLAYNEGYDFGSALATEILPGA